MRGIVGGKGMLTSPKGKRERIKMRTIRQEERHGCYFSVFGGLQVVLLATLLAASMAGVHAAKSQFERTKPHVNVGTIGHVELREPALSFDFIAELETGSSGQAAGTVQFLMADGSVRTLRAAIGRVHLEGDQVLVFFLLIPDSPSGQPDPTRPATAVLQQRAGKIFWEIEGTELSEKALRFELPGEI